MTKYYMHVRNVNADNKITRRTHGAIRNEKSAGDGMPRGAKCVLVLALASVPSSIIEHH